MELDVVEPGGAEVRVHKPGPVQFRVAQIGPLKVCVFEIHAVEIRAGEVAVSQIDALQIGLRTEEQQGLVVLFSTLPDAINAGYEEARFTLVQTVNGRAPRDMAHFVELVEGAGAEIEIRTNTHAVITLDPAAVAAAQPAILERYGVPCDRSDDLLRR